jgi:hypothetical protein
MALPQKSGRTIHHLNPAVVTAKILQSLQVGPSSFCQSSGDDKNNCGLLDAAEDQNTNEINGFAGISLSSTIEPSPSGLSACCLP